MTTPPAAAPPRTDEKLRHSQPTNGYCGLCRHAIWDVNDECAGALRLALDRALAEKKKLQATLRKLDDHPKDCAYFKVGNRYEDCDCGLYAANEAGAARAASKTEEG